jgi:L-lactate dehydrogenase complex protein LldG
MKHRDARAPNPSVPLSSTSAWRRGPGLSQSSCARGCGRAAGAIAETGTIILDDARTSRRLAAVAPWIHVAVFGPAQIHAHVINAIAALGDDPNVIWCTGPSKTADVEGILIEGVHGPGEQIALIVGA